MLPMLVGFQKMRVEGSGYRQKAADQPFNLLKIAGVTARQRTLRRGARGPPTQREPSILGYRTNACAGNGAG
jgi:hypothetical protein